MCKDCKEGKTFSVHKRAKVRATPYPIHTTHYTLHPTPYTLHPEPYTLQGYLAHKKEPPRRTLQ